jgi:hypothetical protein
MNSISDKKSDARETWEPGGQARFATQPTGFTRFMRVFFPYQLWRFLVINLKMMRVIRRGHSGH